jgi:hypothetical protein
MPSMDAPLHMASELTTLERIEHLLTVVACATTGQPPHLVCPWRRAGIDSFLKAVSRGS